MRCRSPVDCFQIFARHILSVDLCRFWQFLPLSLFAGSFSFVNVIEIEIERERDRQKEKEEDREAKHFQAKDSQNHTNIVS